MRTSWKLAFYEVYIVEIVQANAQAMEIIKCNYEAASYVMWIPNEHTIAYFPLIDDAKDTIKWITLSNSWTKQTLWRTFNTTVNYSNTWETNKTRFISLRVKINSWLGWTTCCTQMFDVWDIPCSYCTSHSSSQFRNSTHCNDTSNNRPYINTWMSQWTRYLFCAWYENWVAYYWKNWVKQIISNSCKSSWWAWQLIRINGAWVNLTLSDLRLEDKIPTDEEMALYWKSTKEKYWY